MLFNSLSVSRYSSLILSWLMYCSLNFALDLPRQQIMWSHVSSRLQRQHWSFDWYFIFLSDTAVGIMSLHILVASTSRAILLRPTDKDFHTINSVVASDHPKFSCKCAMYQGYINAPCICWMLMVIDIHRMWSTMGHDGSKATFGRYCLCACWYTPAKASASVFNCTNSGNLSNSVVLSWWPLTWWKVALIL